MKIIGKTKDGYICEVLHSELEKPVDKYYGHLNPLNLDDELDLGQGYSFRNDINNASKKMVDAVEAFEQAQKNYG